MLNLLQLSQLAHQSGQLVAHRPPATSADFLAAKQYEAASMPPLHGRLQPVVYRPAKFGTGYTLFGERVCGGYFRDKVKPAA